MGHDFAIYLSLPSLRSLVAFLSPRGAGSPRLGPRGKTSGTEFKFHKLVCPLHPRRNRDRLIYLSSRGPTFLRCSRRRARHADGSWKAWVPSPSLYLSFSPAGRPDRITIWTATNHNAGAQPQISPRDPRGSLPRQNDPSCFNQAHGSFLDLAPVMETQRTSSSSSCLS